MRPLNPPGYWKLGDKKCPKPGCEGDLWYVGTIREFARDDLGDAEAHRKIYQCRTCKQVWQEE